MTCRQWSGFVVLGSVIVATGTPGCAKKLARSSPAVSIPLPAPEVPPGAPESTSAEAPPQAPGNADRVRPSKKARNDKQRRSIAADQPRPDLGQPTPTSGTATAAGTNWSVVVTTPPPALDDGGREAAVDAGTLASTSSHRYRAQSGVGVAAAMAIALALIAAIVVAPKFLD